MNQTMNDDQSKLKIIKFVNDFKPGLRLEIVTANNAEDAFNAAKELHPEIELRHIDSIFNYFKDFEVYNLIDVSIDKEN